MQGTPERLRAGPCGPSRPLRAALPGGRADGWTGQKGEGEEELMEGGSGAPLLPSAAGPRSAPSELPGERPCQERSVQPGERERRWELLVQGGARPP